MSIIEEHTKNPVLLFWAITFLGAILLQLFYVFFVFKKLAFYQIDKSKPTNRIPISIIIAAKNESNALLKNLSSVLDQKYPQFEVIVVNNNSVDRSSEVLDDYKKKYDFLKIITLNTEKHISKGKKLALTMGIKAAKYEHLVFTDADCSPTSNKWLNHMSHSFEGGKDIILGYGPYNDAKTWINKIIRFDTAWIGINYFSYALIQIPYMGVGRNLGYTKKAYHQVNGFKSHYAMASGDDDLFIQEASQNASVGIQIKSESFCKSNAKTTLSDWINQKSRHYTTSVKYGFIKKVLLATYPVSLIAAWFSFVSLMVLGNFSVYYLFALGMITIIKWWIQGKCLKKIKEQKFALFFPIWDLFYAFLIPIIYVLAKKKQNNDW